MSDPLHWHKVTVEAPPEDEMVLLSWGGLEGSQVGYRYVGDNLESYYCIGGDSLDGDDPEWWMRIPDVPE